MGGGLSSRDISSGIIFVSLLEATSSCLSNHAADVAILSSFTLLQKLFKTEKQTLDVLVNILSKAALLSP